MLALSPLSTATTFPGSLAMNVIKSFARGTTTPFSSTTVAVTNETSSHDFEIITGFADRTILAALPAVRSSSVASGILPDVEGGILPPGFFTELTDAFEFPMPVAMAVFFPPGWKPGSTAGKMPAATFRPSARNVPGSYATFHTRGDASLLIGFAPRDFPFKKSSTSSQLE